MRRPELPIEYGLMRASDQADLARVYRAALSAPERVLQLNALHQRAVPGLARRVHVARVDGRVVAAMTAVPVELRGGGQTLRAAWQQDSAVLPHYRQRGIARALIESAAGDADVLLVKGSSAPMLRLRCSVGFVEQKTCDFLVCPLGKPRGRGTGWGLLDSLALKRRSCGALEVDETGDAGVEVVEDLDPAFDALESERALRPVLASRRGTALLRSRYLDLPGRNYRILTSRHGDNAQALVLRPPGRLSGKAWLVDWIRGAADEASGDRLIRAGVREARRLGATLLAAFASDPAARRQLQRNGFLRTFRSPGFAVRAQNDRARELLERYPLDIWHGDGDLEMVENWEERR